MVVHHQRSDGTEVDVAAACSGALFSQPPAAEIPCRRVSITRLPGGIAPVVIDAWDVSNGDWKWR